MVVIWYWASRCLLPEARSLRPGARTFFIVRAPTTGWIDRFDDAASVDDMWKKHALCWKRGFDLWSTVHRPQYIFGVWLRLLKSIDFPAGLNTLLVCANQGLKDSEKKTSNSLGPASLFESFYRLAITDPVRANQRFIERFSLPGNTLPVRTNLVRFPFQSSMLTSKGQRQPGQQNQHRSIICLHRSLIALSSKAQSLHPKVVRLKEFGLDVSHSA